MSNIAASIQSEVNMFPSFAAPAPATAAGTQFVPVPIETTKYVVNANYSREQTPDTLGETLMGLINLNT